MDPTTPKPARILLTAGPTHEPIDAVRYLANRSSGRVGIAIADAAAARGHQVTLLLGPTCLTPEHPQVRLERFQSTADLELLLGEHLQVANLIIMAAAVADYRPKTVFASKIKRDETGTRSIELEPTPDLLRACAERRRPGQLLVGFALEPERGLLEAAAAKLERKKIDAIVANPLETMDSGEIDATLLFRPSLSLEPATTQGPIPKTAFAQWLLDQIEPLLLRSSS